MIKLKTKPWIDQFPSFNQADPLGNSDPWLSSFIQVANWMTDIITNGIQYSEKETRENGSCYIYQLNSNETLEFWAVPGSITWKIISNNECRADVLKLYFDHKANAYKQMGRDILYPQIIVGASSKKHSDILKNTWGKYYNMYENYNWTTLPVYDGAEDRPYCLVCLHYKVIENKLQQPSKSFINQILEMMKNPRTK